MDNVEIRDNFIEALLNIYNMEHIKFFLEFLQGEQAVLFAIKFSNLKTSSDISEKLGVSKSRLTKVLNNLKRKKYIHFKQSSEDKRYKYIYLTSLGEEYIKTKESTALMIFETYLNKMTSEKIITFTKLLNETVSIMEGVELND